MSTARTNHNKSTSELLTVVEAADILGVGRTMAYALIRSNEWPTPIVRVGRLIKVPAAPLRRLVATNEYLDRRTGGMIGSLSQLVRGAAILGIEDRSEKITRELLDIVPVDYAAERADSTRNTGRGRGKQLAG